MRIRLPWTARLTTALDHFDRFRGVLHHLRADPERFVQKSVGNNLNDLMKEDPVRAWSVIGEWEAELEVPTSGGAAASDGAVATGTGAGGSVSDEAARRAMRWIIHHGTRSLRKKT
jgi:3-methyladenine DNA glycosylase AlkC